MHLRLCDETVSVLETSSAVQGLLFAVWEHRGSTVASFLAVASSIASYAQTLDSRSQERCSRRDRMIAALGQTLQQRTSTPRISSYNQWCLCVVLTAERHLLMAEWLARQVFFGKDIADEGHNEKLRRCELRLAAALLHVLSDVVTNNDNLREECLAVEEVVCKGDCYLRPLSYQPSAEFLQLPILTKMGLPFDRAALLLLSRSHCDMVDVRCPDADQLETCHLEEKEKPLRSRLPQHTKEMSGDKCERLKQEYSQIEKFVSENRVVVSPFAVRERPTHQSKEIYDRESMLRRKYEKLRSALKFSASSASKFADIPAAQHVSTCHTQSDLPSNCKTSRCSPSQSPVKSRNARKPSQSKENDDEILHFLDHVVVIQASQPTPSKCVRDAAISSLNEHHFLHSVILNAGKKLNDVLMTTQNYSNRQVD